MHTGIQNSSTRCSGGKAASLLKQARQSSSADGTLAPGSLLGKAVSKAPALQQPLSSLHPLA